MRKSVTFFEKVFTDKFYINGIDVFDENNVELLEFINIDLGIVSSDSKIDNAKLCIVKELGIKIVIAKKEDYAIVCYPNYRTFLNSANHTRHKESQLLNAMLVFATAQVKVAHKTTHKPSTGTKKPLLKATFPQPTTLLSATIVAQAYLKTNAKR